ncbi:hypothetical protein [Microbacterium sp. KR10-403]|uniref:hypothetical protein n=1 Tax=Microbacterium sp. KR10-403 TaxID=3158581 RepID=UPI0032E40A34
MTASPASSTAPAASGRRPRFRRLSRALATLAVSVGIVAASLTAAHAAPAPATDLDGTCAVLRTGGSHSYVTRSAASYGTLGTASKAVEIRFEATALGRYRLIDVKGNVLYLSVLGTVMPGTSWGDRAEWAVTRDGDEYQIASTKNGKRIGSLLGTLVTAHGTFRLEPATGCASAADVDPGVSGTPEPTVNADGTLNGFIDDHTHITAAVAFGGRLRCGEPFSPGGVEVALAGCLSHSAVGLGGYAGALIAGTDPFMDYKGWPAFTDWPTPTTLLHEQAYFRGIQRVWMSGERILNALLVANRVICDVYPDKGTSCDEMDQIRLQAKYLHDMQDYIDAQSGGPGKGWFRIATTPAQVRQIAAEGKLAVIVGVENSELFGCREIDDVPQCTTDDIDAGLDELESYGVSGIYPVHKFDNAFGGTRFDAGTQGAAVNIGNKISTGHWWQTETCTGAEHDNDQPLRSDEIAGLLSSSGLPAGTVLPVYPTGPLCNVRGLTDLGRYLVDRAMDRGMMIHIDHMGVKTADAVLDIAAARHYPGVITAHTWSDPAVIARIADLGGFVGSYATAAYDDEDKHGGFIDVWRENNAAANPGAITGYGFGTDVNGLGDQAAARSDAATNPLEYPATALNGVTLDRFTMGERTFDLNTDGVATYGLQADWTVDIVQQAGPDAAKLKAQLMNGAEAYTEVWEAARAWQG